MNVYSIIFFSVIQTFLIRPSIAHLQGLCTTSSINTPGDISFWLPTYHQPNTPPGTLYIKDPMGTVYSASFGQVCGVSIPYTTSVSDMENSFKTDTCFNNLKSNSSGLKLVDNATTLTCYGTMPSSEAPNNDIWVKPLLNTDAAAGSCYTRTITSWYPVYVRGASSGIFEVWTTGTNQDLDPHGSTAPCTMSVNNHIYLTLAINDGGTACSNGVPSSLQTGVATGGNCGPSNSGFVCQVTCQTGWQATGVLKCDNGQWNNNFACIDSNTAVPLPTTSIIDSTLQALVTQHGNIVGIEGNGCSTITKSGTLCSIILVDGSKITNIQAVYGGTWSSTSNSTTITLTPTPSPTPPTPLSQSPTPAPSQCPTYSPSPSPSPAPTLSPSPAPSPSPTPAPSPAPSPSPTPAPSPTPTSAPTSSPTPSPSPGPTPSPSPAPTLSPSPSPTPSPTLSPSPSPTQSPSPSPTQVPTQSPTIGICKTYYAWNFNNERCELIHKHVIQFSLINWILFLISFIMWYKVKQTRFYITSSILIGISIYTIIINHITDTSLYIMISFSGISVLIMLEKLIYIIYKKI